MARRVVLQGIAGAVAGGNPAMRPDQQLQPTSRAGTGPAPQNAFLVNPVIVVTPGRGVFIYSPTAGHGNLIASIAATGGTDPYGNAYLAGINSYLSGVSFAGLTAGSIQLGSENAGSLVTANSVISFDDAIVASGQPGLTLGSARTSGGPGVDVALLGESQDTTKPSQVVIAVGIPVPATKTLLEVQGSAALKNATAPASVAGYAEPFATGGNLAVVSGTDGNVYDTQVLHVDLPSTNVTAVTPAFTTIGSAITVAAQKYKIHVRGQYTEAAAAVPRFSFASPTTSSATSSMMWQQNNGTGTFGGQGASLGPLAGPTMAGLTQIVDYWGEATFTASGSLQFEANTNNVVDNFQWNTGTMELYPVN